LYKNKITNNEEKMIYLIFFLEIIVVLNDFNSPKTKVQQEQFFIIKH